MKIEMGESLGLSWMKHVQKCVLVQLNWKAAPLWEMAHEEECQSLFHDAREIFESVDLDVFKGNVGVEQLLRQTECDVLGVRFVDGQVQWNALEVAFHEQGLNYGSRAATIAKVAAKLFRICLCMYAYLGARTGFVCFATPKVHSVILERILKTIEIVRNYFKEKGFDYEIQMFGNEDFSERILDPVKNISEQVADTSELFLRSLQLLNLAPQVIQQDVLGRNVGRRERRRCVPQEEGERIGQHVRNILPELLPQLSEEEIHNLRDQQWCQFTFRMNYPVLLRREMDIRPNHYWAHPVVNVRGVEYWLCCEWHERNRGLFDAWLAQHLHGEENR